MCLSRFSRYDPESELYYYRARYYWPEIGRFVETDPIGYADQMNLYAYVGNNPLNATDPTGMMTDFSMGPGLENYLRAAAIAAENEITLDAWSAPLRWSTGIVSPAVSR